MSLFDVLRYPLSNPITVEELGALPASVLVSFANTKAYDQLLDKLIPRYPALNRTGDCSEELKVLKQLLEEYEDNPSNGE